MSYTLLLRQLRQKTTGGLNKILMAALMQTGIFLPSLYFLISGQVSFRHSMHDWIFLLFGGFMLAGLMVTNVWALAHLEASTFTLIYNLRLLLVTVLG